MGLMDTMMGALQTAQSGAPAGSADLMGLVAGLLNNLPAGSLQGLVQAFASQGLGDVVASWVGKGANLPISAEQIMAALGGPVQSLAASTGQPPGQLANLLSAHLPGLIDQLTPNGQLPTSAPLAAGLGALKGLLP